MIYIDRLNDDIIYYKDKNTYGTGYPSSLIEDDNLIITQDMSLQLKFKERNISYESLSNLLRLPENMTLYDIFSFYFSVPYTRSTGCCSSLVRTCSRTVRRY